MKIRHTVKLKSRPSAFWRNFTKTLNETVFNQERAVRKAVRSLQVLDAGLQDTRRPPSPLLFAGPPGSGKTYLAETLASVWLGEPQAGDEVGPLVKISGENYSHEHEGATLKGAPPGYVGYGEHADIENVGVFDAFHRLAPARKAARHWITKMRSQLGEERFQKIYPYINGFIDRLFADFSQRYAPFRSVLLVDEFEKMHPTVQKQFLGILDTGELQMHNGRRVDFRATLTIFTSNIGTERITGLLDNGDDQRIGFKMPKRDSQQQERTNQRIYDVVREEVRKYLDPALYSRIGHDGIVVFHSLSRDDYARILDKEIAAVQKMVDGSAGKGVLLLQTTSSFREFLLSYADTPREGARQIGSIVLKYMREPLARSVESGELRDGDEILFDVEDGATVLRRTPRPKGRGRKLPPFRDEQDKAKTDTDRDVEKEIISTLDQFWQELMKQLNFEPTNPRAE